MKTQQVSMYTRAYTGERNGGMCVPDSFDKDGVKNVFIDPIQTINHFMTGRKGFLQGYEILIDILPPIVLNPRSIDLANCTMVAYDLESHGLFPSEHHITEIGACKIKLQNGVPVKTEMFQGFVKSEFPILSTDVLKFVKKISALKSQHNIKQLTKSEKEKIFNTVSPEHAETIISELSKLNKSTSDINISDCEQIANNLFSLKNPILIKKTLSDFLSELTHITPEMLNKYGKHEWELLKSFIDWVGPDSILLGHNNNEYDLPTINKQLEKYGMEPWYPPQIDTLPLSRALFKSLSHRLSNLSGDLKMTTDNLKEYIEKLNNNTLDPSIPPEKLILENKEEFLNIISSDENLDNVAKILIAHPIFKNIKFTYDPKYQHRAPADAAINLQAWIQTVYPILKEMGITNLININDLRENNMLYVSQNKPKKVIVFPNQKYRNKLIKLSQQDRITPKDLLDDNKNFINCNSPSSTEIITSASKDLKKDFINKLNLFDFIVLPPPSFWTNLLSPKTTYKVLDLDDYNDALLYKNLKQLTKCLKSAKSVQEKSAALGSSKIFSKLKITQSKAESLMAKIEQIINPDCKFELDKKNNKVNCVLYKAPKLTLEELQNIYRIVIKTCKEINKPLIINNDVLVNSKKQIPELVEELKYLYNSPYKRFITNDEDPKFYLYSPEELKQEFAFLDDPELVNEICFENPLKIYQEIENLQIDKEIKK